MKKLFLSMILMALPLVVSAYDCQVDGIYYNLNSEKNEAEVTYQKNYGGGYPPYQSDYSGSVIIPEKFTYEDVEYSVTSIGDHAFYGCKGLTSVTIPNSVTSIKDWAFMGCRGMTSITIPNFMSIIGEYVFWYCTGLTSITIPNSVTSIGNYAFYNCSGLTSVTIGNPVTIGNSVTNIGGYAFRDCTSLTSLTIGNSVAGIGQEAFGGCTGLTSVTIPNSVTSIGNCAFRECSSLTSITIPNSVTHIGFSAFYGCISLTSMTIPNSVTSINEGTFAGCSGLTSINIPNSVTRIGGYAFYNCSNLISMTIPNSVTRIGKSAFFNCNGLASTTIPDFGITYPIPKAIDLGLPSGTKWANMNLGASSEDEIGDYFGWADPTGELTFDSYNWRFEEVDGAWTSPYFGGTNPPRDISGTELDIATSKLGKDWCIPSSDDFKELSDYCFFEDLDTYVKVTGPNGKSIRMPKSGMWNWGGYVNNPEYENSMSWAACFWASTRSDYNGAGSDYYSKFNYPAADYAHADKDGIWGADGCCDSWYRNGMIPIRAIKRGGIAENDYKLIYMVDGVEYKSSNVEYGETITPEPYPTKEGYSFSGWSEIPEIMPASDLTITGTFIPNMYKLTYLVDGGEYKTSEVEFRSAITAEENPTKEGYTFSGWSEIPETMPASDVTITGSFTINKYKLTYTLDGEEYKTAEVDYGTALTPEEAPVKEGYTFSGWSEIPETMPANDVTVTGTFTANKYKLTYMVDGEEYKASEVDYGTAITAEAVPTKEGYTFSGWSEIPSTMPAEDVTVTGTFTVNKYTITYMVDDAVLMTEDVAYGSTIAPPKSQKDGYDILWSFYPTTMPAYSITINGTYTTGINTLTNEEDDRQVFTPDGKRVETPKKGLNIFRMNDGTVKKVVVK